MVDEPTSETVLQYLVADGFEVKSYLKTGQLKILTTRESYLVDHTFDPGRMIELLRAETVKAFNRGYAGLRAAQEMTWVLSHLQGPERILEYEAQVHTFLSAGKCLIMGLYDRRRFHPSFLADVLAIHRVVAMGTKLYENFFQVPPSAFLGPVGAEAIWELCTNSLKEHHRSGRALKHAKCELQKTATQLFELNQIGRASCRERV